MNGDGTIEVPPNVSIITRRQLLHPDIVAPIQPIHTISDMYTMTTENTSLPSSSMIAAASSQDYPLSDSECSQSTIVCEKGQGHILPKDDMGRDMGASGATGKGETRIKADMLQQQLEMMRRQMGTLQMQIANLTRGSAGSDPQWSAVKGT